KATPFRLIVAGFVGRKRASKCQCKARKGSGTSWHDSTLAPSCLSAAQVPRFQVTTGRVAEGVQSCIRARLCGTTFLAHAHAIKREVNHSGFSAIAKIFRFPQIELLPPCWSS